LSTQVFQELGINLRRKTTHPLSVGETRKVIMDCSSWDSAINSAESLTGRSRSNSTTKFRSGCTHCPDRPAHEFEDLVALAQRISACRRVVRPRLALVFTTVPETSTQIPQILVDGYDRGDNTDPHTNLCPSIGKRRPNSHRGYIDPTGSQDDVEGNRWKIEKELDALIGVYGVKSALIP
jgi:hypothetical protein